MKNKTVFVSQALFVSVLILSSFLTGCLSFLFRPPAKPFEPGGGESIITGMWRLEPTKKQGGQLYIFEEDGSFVRQNSGDIPIQGYYSFDGERLKVANRFFAAEGRAVLSEGGEVLTIIYDDTTLRFRKIETWET
jgi:hypothetical protein